MKQPHGSSHEIYRSQDEKGSDRRGAAHPGSLEIPGTGAIVARQVALGGRPGRDETGTVRRRGITVRKTVDCFIATFAIENGFSLLHNDQDFDPFEEHLNLEVVH